MIPFTDLDLGFVDSRSYNSRNHRTQFSKLFVQTEALDELVKPNISFLIGEKGTGKTAYAVYLSIREYQNTQGSLKYLGESDYEKFVKLKQTHQLDLSSFTNIWQVVLLLLISEQLCLRHSSSGLLSTFDRFRSLKKAIDHFYKSAFSPEIIYAIQFAEKSEISAKIVQRFYETGGKIEKQREFTKSSFQTNLLFLRKTFEDALKSLSLPKSEILFIDGIDIRPSNIPYPLYLECVKGLASAVWSLNNDFFPSIRDSQGRLKIVLLLRPDIFVSLNLQNQNAKAHDNSVLLDWITDYDVFRESSIFRVADRLLASQQPHPCDEGEAWQHYVPFNISDLTNFTPAELAFGDEKPTHNARSSFVSFLRFSLYRPRDIVRMLQLLQKQFTKQRKSKSAVIQKSDFDHADFRKLYAQYLLGEVRDHLAFYHSDSTYEDIVAFFSFLNGQLRFTYLEFTYAFEAYKRQAEQLRRNIPDFLNNSDEFLQLLFELNILCWVQDAPERKFFHWAVRERSLSNVRPIVKLAARYEVHYGFAKALNLGKKFKL